MKRCCTCKQELALDQFGKNRSKSDGLHVQCKTCARASFNSVVAADPEKRKAVTKAWRASNPDKAVARTKAWKRANPEDAAHLLQARKSCIKTQTPPWADREEMEAIRQETRRLTTATGIAHHSDHIVPLKAAVVCKGYLITASGLEVPANLQILTATENCRKHTDFEHGWEPHLDLMENKA